MSPHPARFLIEGPVEPGGRVELERAEARHAMVRRLRAGETVALFDGAGRSWLGAVERIGRERIVVQVTRCFERDAAESALDLTLAAALLKADRFDWLVEKATELGVTAIQPMISRYSLARPSAARQERWRQIALGAVKQCGRSRLPRIEPPAPLADVASRDGLRLVLCETGGEASLARVQERFPDPAKITLIIGPEGGFAAEEIEAARSSGCKAVGLGQRILRAETAAVTAVALCQHLWGDLG